MAIRKVVSRSIGTDVIAAEDLANNSVTVAEIQDDAVTSAKIDSTSTGMSLADLAVDTDTLYVDASNNRVGIGTSTPEKGLHLDGADIRMQGVIPEIGFISPDGSSNTYHFGANISDSVDGGFVWGSGVTVSGGSRMLRLDSDGLKFGSDSAAANALNDYEEGTFTPTINAVSSNPTVTYSGQDGNYVLIGHLIFVNMNVSWSSLSGGSGLFRVGNLPYQPKGGNGNRAVGSIPYVDGFSGLTNAYGLEPHTNLSSAANGTYFYYKGSGGNIASYVGIGDIKSSGNIQVCLVYQVG